MILKLLNEDIDNKKLEKEYINNYSDLSEDEFLTMVEMDPSSYPRLGQNNFDLSADPIGVGNLASGGKGGLLIRCFRNGEKDFLNNFKEVQDACLKYLQNRSSYSIKNAGAFPSVKKFIEYINSDGALELNDINNVAKEKKANNPIDKLEQLRQKQFPSIPTVEELIMVADLDEESDTEHGQVGNVAKTLLLPHYAAGERDFVKKKLSIKKAIQKFYNSSDSEIAKNPISKYNEKENNNYIRTVMDFIEDWGINIFKESNLKHLLTTFADPECYRIWASTKNYDIIEYSKDARVGYCLNLCDLTPEEVLKEFPNSDNPLKDWAGKYDTSIHSSSGKVTNIWCTGWHGSYINRYSGDGKTLVAFINRNRIPFEKECHKNWQVSMINSSASFDDIEDGNNNHDGWRANIGGFLSMLEQNKDVLGVLLSHDPFNRSSYITDLGKRLGVTPINNLVITDNEEEEIPSFTYTSPDDVVKYKNETGDINCLNVYTLIIADGVTEIPDFQFQNWRNVDKIIFPESLKEIGSKAFSGCSSLVKLNLPANLEKIGLGAFEGCTGLRGSIRLPLSIKQIDQNAFAFHNRKGLKFVISPKRLDAENYGKLLLPEEDHDFWFTPGRIKFSDN